MIEPYKRKILNKVYHMYLDSIDVQTIASYLCLTNDEINEIIDYLNKLYA